MISHEHKAIFIHIEKTAGTSVEKALGHFSKITRGVQDHKKLKYYVHISDLAYQPINIKYAFYNLRRGNFKKTFFYLKNLVNPELSKKQYQSYFKFTIVRNTWSRLYSYYNAIMQDDFLKERYNIAHNCSFKSFLTEFINRDFSQLNYIVNKENVVDMNFIARFEHIEDDYKTIANKLELPDDSLPILLKSTYATSYKEAYDDVTKAIVFRMFKKEIEYFKFKF